MTNNITTIESIKNNKMGSIGSIRSLHESLDLVINDLGMNSDNTKTSYKKTLEDFINFTFNKTIENIEWSDLEMVKHDHALVFRDYLKNARDCNDGRKLKYQPRSIKQKISALSSIFKALSKINENIKGNSFEMRMEKFDESKNSYGSLTEDEVDRLLDYCLDLPPFQKPLEKSLFFETAYVTAIRSGALMKLTWGDIKKRKDSLQDVEYNIIKTQDKGISVEVPIDDNLYGRIMIMKEAKIKRGYTTTELKTERVFPVTRKTLSKCLKDFCEIEGIDEERNIVLHSLKKASIDKVYKETGDINITARHGHHKGVEMVYKHYQGKNDGLANSPSLSLFNNSKRELGELVNLTREQLLEAIENCNGLVIDSIIRSHKDVNSKKISI